MNREELNHKIYDTLGVKSHDLTWLMERIDEYTNSQVKEELNEARKWATKADSADQVWQQLSDRIKEL